MDAVLISPKQWIDRSDDVHRQANLLQDWDQTYSQLGSGRFAGSVLTFQYAGLKIFRETMNRSVFQSGGLPSYRLAFGLPLQGRGSSCICGEEGSPNSVLVFSGGSGFEFFSPDLFEFVGIEVDTLASDDSVLLAMMHDLRRTLSGGRRAIAIVPGKASKLQWLLDGILSEEELGDRLGYTSGHAEAFSRSMIGQFLDILQDADCDRQGTVRRHWEAVAAIRLLVTDSDTCPLSVAELTRIMGLSRRTLQNACQSILGMSPIRFLRALRLSEARKTLQRAGSVTQVATQFGFWHLGYFSRDYHAMFGELPSQTVQHRG